MFLSDKTGTGARTVLLMESDVVLLKPSAVDAVAVPEIGKPGDERPGNGCETAKNGLGDGDDQGQTQDGPKSR